MSDMIRLKFYFFLLVLGISIGMCVGCSDDDPVILPDLKLKTDLVEIPADGGRGAVAYLIVNSLEGVSLKIGNTPEWISDVIVTPEQITFRVAANESESVREGQIDVIYPQIKTPVSFKVRQMGATSFTVERNEVEVSAEGGSLSVAYNITNPIAGERIGAECQAEWVRKLEVSDKAICFDVDKQVELEAREAVVKVVYGRFPAVEILVRQGAAEAPVLVLEAERVEIGAEGGHERIAYHIERSLDGAKLSVSSVDTWIENLTVGSDTISFDVVRNTAMEIRETVVSVEYPHVEPRQILVKQSGALQPEIVLESRRVEFPADGGTGEVHYSLRNPIEGQVVSVESEAVWIEQLSTDGQTITFSVGVNPESVIRTATVRVNYLNADEVSFEVCQAAGESDKMQVEANGVKFTMIRIQGGTFMMGATEEQYCASGDEYPVHKVTLSEFFMGQYEVTQELWEAVMGSNPSSHTGDSQLPVDQVSWDECQAFVGKLNEVTGLNFSLPTEAQWEYAARGGEKARGLLFSGSDFSEEVAWNDSNSNFESHPVGQLAPNELGLYDMSGNLYEWCMDFYGDYTEEPQTDPSGVADGWGRILRGGCFYEWGEGKIRVSSRHMDAPDICDYGYGLRLVLTK